MLTFGKYRGIALPEVPPSYLRSLLSKKLPTELKDAIKEVLARDDLDEDIPFGKYKGCRLNFLIEHDPKYMMYLRRYLEKVGETGMCKHDIQPLIDALDKLDSDITRLLK